VTARRARRWMTRQEQRVRAIVETDRRQAVQAAEEAVLARFLAEAPYSYVELQVARRDGRLAAVLSSVPPPLLRAQAVRFLVERHAAAGLWWGWGDVDEVERIFRAFAQQP
jgi:hypothetical protein